MTAALLDEVYPQWSFEPVRADGVWLEDAAGRRVLDLYGGHAVAVLGYGHPQFLDAVCGQLAAMVFQSNAARLGVRERAATKLVDFAGLELSRVFFVNSGAEANENALRLAFRATGRSRVVAIEHGFHGRTAAAAAVTHGAARWYGFPRLPFEVDFVPRDDVAALTEAITKTTAAVILEPVQGLAGAYPLSRDYLIAAREATAAVGAKLIFDEVQSGMGRLGAPFGATLHGVEPDLLTVAKGIAGGLPAGAVLMRADIAAGLKGGDLGTTFGGGPVTAAAVESVIDAIRAESLLDNVRAISDYIRETCVTGPVESLQGLGLLLGLKTTPPAAVVRDALLQHDILTGTSTDPHVLRLLPPLTLGREHVERLASALGEIKDA